MDYARNAKYFKKPKYGFPIFLIILGVCFFVGAVQSGSGGLFVVVIAAAVIGFVLVRAQGGKPTDDEMDAQVKQPADLLETALERNGITIEDVQKIPPIVWGGYYNPDELFAAGSSSGSIKDLLKTAVGSVGLAAMTGMQSRKGSDGLARTSLTWWGVWLFSNTEMYTYTVMASLTSNWSETYGSEYPYQEIRNITVEDSDGYRTVQFSMIDGKVETGIVHDDTEMAAVNALRQEIRSRRS
jgi:hypothetical protein